MPLDIILSSLRYLLGTSAPGRTHTVYFLITQSNSVLLMPYADTIYDTKTICGSAHQPAHLTCAQIITRSNLSRVRTFLLAILYVRLLQFKGDGRVRNAHEENEKCIRNFGWKS
jgi:hypothetical protein